MEWTESKSHKRRSWSKGFAIGYWVRTREIGNDGGVKMLHSPPPSPQAVSTPPAPPPLLPQCTKLCFQQSGSDRSSPRPFDPQHVYTPFVGSEGLMSIPSMLSPASNKAGTLATPPAPLPWLPTKLGVDPPPRPIQPRFQQSGATVSHPHHLNPGFQQSQGLILHPTPSGPALLEAEQHLLTPTTSTLTSNKARDRWTSLTPLAPFPTKQGDLSTTPSLLPCFK